MKTHRMLPKNSFISSMMSCFKSIKAFSIIEVLFAVAILSGVFYAITALFAGSSKQVDQMRKTEELLFIQQNAQSCFRSLGYSAFADASGNLLMTGGSLSFGTDNSKCLVGNSTTPQDIAVKTYFWTGTKSETEVGSRIYIDTFLVSTGSNLVSVENTISAYGSGWINNTSIISIHKK